MDKNAEINFMDIQPGDVEKTFADISNAKNKLSLNRKPIIQKGIPKFIQWYKSYHKIINSHQRFLCLSKFLGI